MTLQKEELSGEINKKIFLKINKKDIDLWPGNVLYYISTFPGIFMSVRHDRPRSYELQKTEKEMWH